MKLNRYTIDVTCPYCGAATGKRIILRHNKTRRPYGKVKALKCHAEGCGKVYVVSKPVVSFTVAKLAA
jgi:sarcosine oxidase delta subunit